MSATRSLSDEQLRDTARRRSITMTPASFPAFAKIYDEGPAVRWENEVIGKLDEVLSLPEGWDSYSAPQVSWAAAMFGLIALRATMHPRTPAPDVVPTPDGAVQFVWDYEGLEIEFTVSGPYDAEMSFSDERDHGQTVSVSVSQDFGVLAAAIAKLLKR